MKIRTCFLIDDDNDDQEVFNLALQKIDRSIECIFAADGVEAMEKLNHQPAFIPDYIFLDLNMPRMNGKQFLREIKKYKRLSDIPVIIFTTSSNEKDIAETKLLGAIDFITKPAYLSELTNLLSALFHLST